jgi:hypothetical protein
MNRYLLPPLRGLKCMVLSGLVYLEPNIYQIIYLKNTLEFYIKRLLKHTNCLVLNFFYNPISMAFRQKWDWQ